MSRPDRLGGANPPAASESGPASRGARWSRSQSGWRPAPHCSGCRVSGTTRRPRACSGLSVLQGELPIYFFGQSFMGALDGYLAAPLFWLLGVSARTARARPRAARARQRRPDRPPGPRRLRAAGRAVHRGPAGGPAGLPPVLVSRGAQPLPAHDRSRDPRAPPRAAGARRAGRAGDASCSLCWAGASGSPSGPTSSRSSTSRRSRSCSCAADSGPLVPAASSRRCPRSRSAACRTGSTACRTERPCRRRAGRWALGTVLAHLGFFGRTAWPIVAGVPHDRPGRRAGRRARARAGRAVPDRRARGPRARSGVPPRPRARRAWPSSSSRAPTWASRW